MIISLITVDKKRYLDLLLLGDEQESMINRYLERGEMFVLKDNGVKAVCVVTDEGNGVCELKNIAVAPSSQRQGYLHSMFIHKDYQGQGITTMLLREIERYAMEYHIARLTSEVSLTARGFFERQGYVVEKEQKRRANRLSLTNFEMAKALL